MQVTIASQVHVFLYSLAGGMLIAFIYDGFRIKRKTIKTGIFIIQLEDLLFWLLVAFIVFAVLYYSNEGEVRGFIFVGTLLGVILYMFLFSRLVMSVSMFVLKMIFAVLKGVWKIISYPFIVLFRIIKVPVGFLSALLCRGVKKIGRRNKIRKVRVGVWRRMFKNTIKKI